MKERIHDTQECFKVAPEYPKLASELVQDFFKFFDLFLFLFIILARNIDCKSILQKTLKQIGSVASKYEGKSRNKSNFQCISPRRQVCMLMSRNMFLQSAFQFGFLPSKPCLFPLKSSLEFVLHRGKPKFISLQLKFPVDKSKFQFCTTA